MATEGLITMVNDMPLGKSLNRLRLLEHLSKDSEFLYHLRDSLPKIFDGIKVFSFYETKNTPTVKKV